MVTRSQHAGDHCPGLERVRVRIHRPFVCTKVGRRRDAVRSGRRAMLRGLFRLARRAQLVLEHRRAVLYRLHRICQRRGQCPNQPKRKRAYNGVLWSATADVTGVCSTDGRSLWRDRVLDQLVK